MPVPADPARQLSDHELRLALKRPARFELRYPEKPEMDPGMPPLPSQLFKPEPRLFINDIPADALLAELSLVLDEVQTLRHVRAQNERETKIAMLRAELAKEGIVL